MREYHEFLINQYKAATGTRKVDSSICFKKEFYEWLKIRVSISKEYLNLLDYMGLSKVYEAESVEIGKGIMDSVVMPYDTTIITPYTEDMRRSTGTIIEGDFIVKNNTPVIVEHSQNKTVMPIPEEGLTFMTHNPYTMGHIKNWEHIHNSGHNGIILSVFGDANDRDAIDKIEQISEFKSRLDVPFIEESYINKGFYVYVIASESLKLEKKLTR